MKIALWQTHPQGSIEGAVKALADVAKTAAAEGADLLVTPEMFVGGYNIGPSAVADHADLALKVMDALAAIAATNHIALVVGLAMPGAPLPRNACVALDNKGAEIARYHKTHLFGDVDQAQFAAGDVLCSVFEINGWRLALAICYDIEFPELARVLALRGADLIVTPTANMVPFNSVPRRLVPARAEENALYIAYCNYVGSEGNFTYNGQSCVCGPDGQDLARAETQNDQLIFATMDRTQLDKSRQLQSYLSDRCPDLYGEVS